MDLSSALDGTVTVRSEGNYDSAFRRAHLTASRLLKYTHSTTSGSESYNNRTVTSGADSTVTFPRP